VEEKIEKKKVDKGCLIGGIGCSCLSILILVWLFPSLVAMTLFISMSEEQRGPNSDRDFYQGSRDECILNEHTMNLSGIKFRIGVSHLINSF